MKKYMLLSCVLLSTVSGVFAASDTYSKEEFDDRLRRIGERERTVAAERDERGRNLVHSMFNMEKTDDELIRLIDDADLNVVDRMFGFTPLHAAVFFGRLAVVKKLIENGADLFAKAKAHNGAGHTPLHIAIQMKRFDEAIELVLADKRTPAAKNAEGKKPFELLPRNEHESFISKLNAEKRKRGIEFLAMG